MQSFKKILIVGIFLLFSVALFLTFYLKNGQKETAPFFYRKKTTAPQNYKTESFETKVKRSSQKNKKKEDTTLKKTENIFSFINSLPYYSQNLEASYSALLNKVFINEKTKKGKDELKELLAKNSLTLTDISPLIVTNKEIKNNNLSTTKKEAEEILKNVKIQQMLKPRPTPTPYKYKSIEEYEKEKENKTLNALKNLFREIFYAVYTSEETPNITPTPIIPSHLPNLAPHGAPSLQNLISEVSQNVGIPRGVIEAVLKIENPAVFYLTENQIKEYSSPGKTWPNCGPNQCSATGPMQITTGKDNKGSPLCGQCCWQGRCLDTRGGCPNQWSLYKTAVNLYGKFNHSPNVCNIRDNIYAGASKLKHDSGSDNPVVWTKEEVFKAARAYYGDCSVKFSRLGNRTYCEFVWDYYVYNNY